MSTQLMPGEQPIALVRQHWSVIAAPLLGGALLMAAGLAAVVLLPASVVGLQIDGVKRAVLLALVGAALLWWLLNYTRWRMETYLLTDRRIVMEGGVLSRYSESIALDRIQNTVLRRPLGDRLIGAGEIEIESAGRDGLEVMHRIPRAGEFYNRLMQAMEDVRLGQTRLPNDAGVWRDPQL